MWIEKDNVLKAEFQFIPECPISFQIGPINVIPITLSHPNKGNGYKFTEDGKVFVFLTDNELTYRHKGGLLYDDYLEFCRGADILFHDAEFTPEEYDSVRQWGHSRYTDALELAIKAEVRHLGLFHLNQRRTDSEVDSIVEHCNRIASETGADLECFAVGMDMEYEL